MNLDFLKDFSFFSGVPDSQLKELCNFLFEKYGIGRNHIIAANEGNSVALAAGYHLATGKVPVVYLQNSGLGNIINPVTSLLNEKVYGIPCIFIVGWRGEPNVHDEPQHIFQGEITLDLLQVLGIETFVIDKDTTEVELNSQLLKWKPLLDSGKQVALIVKKNAFEKSKSVKYANEYKMAREDIIRTITDIAKNDYIVCTTGKASRELYEIRGKKGQSHEFDFLTVGSMGHSSSIALGIAMQKTDKKIWCIDGDGAALMHMGAMATIGSIKPKNLVHILINNGAHESVGGMSTVGESIDFVSISKGCGYPYAIRVETKDQLKEEIEQARQRDSLVFVEVMCSIGARDDLGRPTSTPKENKEVFMKSLKET